MIQVKVTNLMLASGSAYHISEGCDVAVDGDAWRILAIDHAVAHKRVLFGHRLRFFGACSQPRWHPNTPHR